MSMVMHLRRKMVPAIEKNLLAIMNLCLWKRITSIQIERRAIPVTSVISKAQGMCGTLSRMMSGKGGYLFISGTLSCTTVMVNAVSHDTDKAYRIATAVFHLSGLRIVAKFDFGR